MNRLSTLALVALTWVTGAFAFTEKDAKRFVAAHLPLTDRLATDTAYVGRQVRLTLTALAAMPWGERVPEQEARHFILPPRVADEALDESRQLFFEQLHTRLQGMTMEEAVMEVNHWCRQHAAYRHTDSRTLAPTATMLTAYGNHRELAVMTVAALRAVAIPARLVTAVFPHTDSSRSWVEVWTDGTWHHIDPCQPQPVLDKADFMTDASRAMFVGVDVFGRYADGEAEVVRDFSLLTNINVTASYTPTSRLDVTVVDKKGRAVAETEVECKVWNTAGLTTVATLCTGRDGHASIALGRGDIMIWASKDGLYDMAQASMTHDRRVKLRLGDAAFPRQMNVSMQAPMAVPTAPHVTQQQQQANDLRVKDDDATRMSYEATLTDDRWRGNQATIQALTEGPWDTRMTSKLLDLLTEKDWHDVSLDVLHDNLYTQTATDELNDIQMRYVVNPRIAGEPLVPYKWFLRGRMRHIGSMAELVAWCRDSIVLVSGQNPQQLCQTPTSVYTSRLADDLGKRLFFVATARSLGYPARINEVDGRLQWHDDERWRDVPPLSYARMSQRADTAASGSLRLLFTPAAGIVNPRYCKHFTISRLHDGKLHRLTFPDNSSLRTIAPDSLVLRPGTYILSAGVRHKDGSVAASLLTFDVTPAARTDLSFTLPRRRQQR